MQQLSFDLRVRGWHLRRINNRRILPLSEQTALLTALAGACAGILPIVLTFFMGWLTQRGLAARRAEAVNLARQRVEFLTGWIEAQQALGPDGKLNEMKQAILNELDEAWESVVDLEVPTAFYTPLVQRSLLQRLFLFYAPVTLFGWVYHALYWAAIGSLSFLALLVALSLLSLDLQTLVNNLYVSIFYGTPSLVLAFLFRWLAVKEDRKAEEKARAELERKQARRAGMMATQQPS